MLDEALEQHTKTLAKKFEDEAEKVRTVLAKYQNRPEGTAGEEEITALIVQLNMISAELDKFFDGELPDLALFPTIANLFITLHLKVFNTLFDVLELDIYKNVERLKPYKARLEEQDTKLLELVPEHMLVGLG